MADNLPAALSSTPDMPRLQLPVTACVLVFLWCVLLLTVAVFMILANQDGWAKVFVAFLLASCVAAFYMMDAAYHLAKLRLRLQLPQTPAKE